VDCSLLVRLRDMHVDCCPIINFERFVIQEFGEVESKNSRIQLSNYTATRVMKQLDGAQTSPKNVFKAKLPGSRSTNFFKSQDPNSPIFLKAKI
jgi:hypothetical protein